MDAEQFHNEAIRYVRRVAAKTLSFDGSGLEWALVAEPLLALFKRMIDDAASANQFALNAYSHNFEDDGTVTEASVAVEFSLLSDCDWIDDTSVTKPRRLSEVLCGLLSEGYEADEVLETVAAIERSCTIAREKLACT